MKGYTGKILKINLTDGVSEEIKVDDKVYQEFLSGAGLGAWYIYRNIPRGADPLGPNNILSFTSGLLTGTGSVLTGRFMVMCKSPLTGGIGEANCGGYLSPCIKQCGYDAVFIHGKAEKMVYILVGNKGAEIRDGESLRGLDTTECEERLIRECTTTGKIPAVASIGISGEKLSLISGICTDRGRIAARSGVGAVMGSKNLKAIVFNGTKPIKGENPEEIKKISKELSKAVKKTNLPSFVRPGALSMIKFMPPYVVPMNGLLSAMIMKRWGTSGTMSMCVATGDSPIKNWAGSLKDFKKYKKIDGHKILQREKRKYHCYSCVLGCGGECDIGDLYGGEFKNSHKIEYETQMAFGGLLLNDDLESIFYINEILNRAGMDTIECLENGIITKEDLGGLDLGWGKSKEIIEFVKMMIERRGMGDVFADGTKAAAERLGKGAEKYAIHAGGQECGMHDGRGDAPLAIHYAVDATPGRHTTGSSQYYSVAHIWKKVSWAPVLPVTPKIKEYEPSREEAAKAAALGIYKRVLDGVGGCFFGVIMGVENFKIFEWLNAATGWNKTPDEYMEIGKRIYALRQMFNIRHGIDPKSFRLHKRLAGEPPLTQGPLKGKTLKIDDMMKEYWDFLGYDRETGIPKKETIQALNLIETVGGDING